MMMAILLVFYKLKNNLEISIIKEECNFIGDEIVYDLYSGIGSISIFLSKYVKHYGLRAAVLLRKNDNYWGGYEYHKNF